MVRFENVSKTNREKIEGRRKDETGRGEREVKQLLYYSKDGKTGEKRKIVMEEREQEMRCRNKLCVHVNIWGWRKAVRLEVICLGVMLTTQCKVSSQGHGPRQMSDSHCLTLGINTYTLTHTHMLILTGAMELIVKGV